MSPVGKEYELWGEKVTLGLPKLPTPEQIKDIDEISGSPNHGFFQTSQGKLHFRSYLPNNTDDIKAVCVWQHGIQAHSAVGMKLSSSIEDDGGENNNNNEEDDMNRYTNIGLISRKLMSRNIALYAPDMLGHGFSEGTRFYIPNGKYEINRDHFDNFARYVATQHEGIPLFLMGDSYGGCLALHVAKLWQQQLSSVRDDTTKEEDGIMKEQPNNRISKLPPKQFHGVCISAPAIVGDMPPLPVRMFLQYVLAPLIPTIRPFFMPNPIPPERIWKIEEVRKNNSSPEVRELGLSAGAVPFRLGTALGLLKAMEHVRNQVIPGLNVPFSVCHGNEDWGVKKEGSELLLKICDTKEEDRDVRFVDGGYHDLMSDPTRVENIEFHIRFIEQRISQDKE